MNANKQQVCFKGNLRSNVLQKQLRTNHLNQLNQENGKSESRKWKKLINIHLVIIYIKIMSLKKIARAKKKLQ